MRLNSPGGSVFDAVAIYNSIKRHSGTVTVWIDGIAASAASYIAMAGDEIVMPENAFLMIHDPAGVVMGTATHTALRRKAGARPGDALVLTRALGTGTLLAALMAGARLQDALLGEAVAAALAQMTRPPAPAARALAPHATAMTDVTGFGLAGHLLELCTASGTGADLQLDAIPLLDGAEQLSA